VDENLKASTCNQLFIGVHNETLSVIAMCVSNEDRPPVAIYSCNTTPAPTGFAEIVSLGKLIYWVVAFL
jgi:hypothetical protein